MGQGATLRYAARQSSGVREPEARFTSSMVPQRMGCFAAGELPGGAKKVYTSERARPRQCGAGIGMRSRLRSTKGAAAARELHVTSQLPIPAQIRTCGYTDFRLSGQGCGRTPEIVCCH